MSQCVGRAQEKEIEGKITRAPMLADRVKALSPGDELNLLGWGYGRVRPQDLETNARNRNLGWILSMKHSYPNWGRGRGQREARGRIIYERLTQKSVQSDEPLLLGKKEAELT